jgi:adenylylsulfate kinase-like enzyme
MDKIQERGVDLALRGHTILLTGFPGTGKSVIIIEMAKQLKATGKNVTRIIQSLYYAPAGRYINV